MASILGQGDYKVFLDAGFIQDAFTLDDPVRGQLDNTTYKLDGTTEFFDVTAYVQAVSISRGRRKYREPIDAGRCTIRIDDLNGDFSVVNTASPYWDATTNRLGFQPTRRVRITRNGERLFEGQITTYDQELTLDNQSLITVGASDDLQALDKVLIGTFTPTAQRTDERLAAVLDRPDVQLFTGVGERNLAAGVARVGTQVVEGGVTVQDYFARVQLAEQGRIFMSRAGVFTSQPRIGRVATSSPATLSDKQDGGIPFRSFKVDYQ